MNHPATPSAPFATLRQLLDDPMRDPAVMRAPDGFFYLTGTTGTNARGEPTWWTENDGICVWRSPNLCDWEPLGLVWDVARDGTWANARRTGPIRTVWAPEIAFLRGTFWLTYSIYFGDGAMGSGLLRSLSGEARGPYQETSREPMVGWIDASLFEDADGAVYWVFGNGQIARLNDDLTALAETPRLLSPSNHKHVGFEGAFLARIDGRYHLLAAEFADERGQTVEFAADLEFESLNYHCYAASSDNIYGPYGPRALAVAHGGHNTLFQDGDGAWWSTFFGNDPRAPIRERPAILRVAVNEAGELRALDDQAEQFLRATR